MQKYTEEELKNWVEETYGFKKELIQNPELCGMWFVQFEVNEIQYIGWVSFAGALPQIRCLGEKATYHNNHNTPVTEEYYNEYIKGKRIFLTHCIDRDGGDREKTNVEFKSQEEAEAYIKNLEDFYDYGYDFYD